MRKIVSFGEIMMRLSPPNSMLIKDTSSFDVQYGGTEANVLACLGNWGHDVEYVSVVPDNGLGLAVIQHLRKYNVDTKHILQRGSVLGSYFLEQGCGNRSSEVIYNRSNSEITRVSVDDYDYSEIFKDCALLHVTGISPALSENARDVCFTMLQEAKLRNIMVSFDFNYRPKMWSTDVAGVVYRKIMQYVNIVFLSDLDLSTFLQCETIEDAIQKYPNVDYWIVRNRKVISNNKHVVEATIYHDSKYYKRSPIEFDVFEKVGGGDAFAAGVLHKLLQNENLNDILDFGLACFTIKSTVFGDVLTLTESSIVKSSASSTSINR